MTEFRVVEHESPLEELEAQGYPPSLAKACYDPFEYEGGAGAGQR